MGGTEPVSWVPLTAEEWKNLPNADHTSVFSRDEVEAALRLLAPADEAAAMAGELYSGDQPGTIFFYGDLLSALSTLSDSAAERVRSLSVSPDADAGPERRPLAKAGQERPSGRVERGG